MKITALNPGGSATFTDDAIVALRDLLAGAGRLAVFTGRHSADRCGAWSDFTTAAGLAGADWRRFSEIEPEPGVETVAAMTAFLKESAPDTVLAIGGGSVLDAAKAAWMVHQTGWPLEKHFGVNTFSSAVPGRRLKRIIAVPLTSGTGSEATPYSNIVDHRAGVKKLICEEEIVPDHFLVSPRYNATMSPEVTRATGCDALAHLIEGFLNIGADGNCAQANEWAKAGIAAIVRWLPEALADGSNLKARLEMAQAATLGGMVIRFKSTGLPHLCSFSWFGKVEHGIAVSLILPAAWNYYLGSEAVAARTMELSGIFPGSTPEAVVASCRKFLTSVGVAESLRDYPDITPELLQITARSGAQNKMKLELAPRPVPLDESEEILSRILKSAYYGD